MFPAHDILGEDDQLLDNSRDAFEILRHNFLGGSHWRARLFHVSRLHILDSHKDIRRALHQVLSCSFTVF
jgi:hypothetical protein